MSLTGALMAVFIQQWAQSYLHATRERNSPHNRARIRAFHAEGLENFYLPQVTRAVPILIHGSLFLFFSGLPIFLFNVNHTVFNVVVTWLGLCVAGYACVTLTPIFSQKSPYYSPLSSSIWWCFTNTLFIICRLLKKFMSHDSSVLRWYHARYGKSLLRWPSLRAMQKAAGQSALQLSSDIDYRALLWMFETLNDDEEFEHFFDALPGLHGSKALEDAEEKFIKKHKKKLSHALIGMMDRTLLSELISEEVKQRRIIICTKAISATSLLGPWWTLRRVLFGDWHGFSRSIHFGLFVQGWKNISRPITTFYADYVVAVTLASVQQRDDYWFELASGQLKESKSLLRDYYFTYGDSILLANAIFIIRRTIQTSDSEKDHRSDILEGSSKTLDLICRFDIQNTLPELQHQFCDLWNRLVDGAKSTHPHAGLLCVMMLKSIRRLYLTLHADTPSSPNAFSPSTDDGDRVLDDAKSYPRCSIEDHSNSEPVPDLPLDESPTSASPVTPPLSTNMMPALSSALVQVSTYGGSTYQVAPGSTYQVAPGSPYRGTYQVAPSSTYRDSTYQVAPGSTYQVPRGLPYRGTHQVAPGSSYQVAPGSTYRGSTYQVAPGSTYQMPRGSTYQIPRGLPYQVVPGSPYQVPPDLSYQVAPGPLHPDPTSGPSQTGPAFLGPYQLDPVPRGPHQLGLITKPFSDSPLPLVPEPARAHTQELPINSAGADKPILTPSPATSTHNIDENRSNLGPAATISHLQRPSIPPKMSIPETPPAPSLPTPTSTGSATAAPVLPVVLLTSQERVPTPKPPSPALPQGPPVSPPDISQVPSDTSTPLQVPLDTSSARSKVVKFADLPMAVPDFPPSQTTLVSTAPSVSRPLPFPTHMSGEGSVPFINVNGYGTFSGLLHSSPHKVLYEDELYPTALHLFEARKYLPHRRDLADRIRHCERVEEVISISAELADFVRRDWGNIMLSTVSKYSPYLAPRRIFRYR